MNPAPPPRLTPLYTTPSPSTHIPLYTGQIGIRQGAYTGAGSGAINLIWRVLGPQVRFEVPSLLPADILHPEECVLTAPPIQGDILAFLSGVTTSSGPHGSALGARGLPRHNIVVGIDQPTTQVLFHVVNFWPFLHPRPDPAPIDYDISRVVFVGSGWKVTLQGVDRLSELEEQVRHESGYGITHVGKVERVDGSPFTRAEAHELFHALHSFLSFARGIWSPPILFVGLDASGAQLWHDWTVRQASAGRKVSTWFPVMEPQCLGAIFPGFMRLWQNPDTREILEVAIHWYIEANIGSGAVEGSVILSQTGLERLAYYIMVHDRGLLTEANFQNGPGRLNAAERLRRLFNEFGLPVTVGPVRRRINNLPALATAQMWVDAPDGLVRLRNCIVHPDQHNIQRLQNFPVVARREALTLCLWYYEVILLKWFGYSGVYVNRQTAAFVGETEQIP